MKPLPLRTDEIKSLQESGVAVVWRPLAVQPHQDHNGWWNWPQKPHYLMGFNTMQALGEAILPHLNYLVGERRYVQETYRWQDFDVGSPLANVCYQSDGAVRERVMSGGTLVGWRNSTSMHEQISRYAVTISRLTINNESGVYYRVLTAIIRPKWDTLPKWIKWIAQDEDGEWWGYDCSPEAGPELWYVPIGDNVRATLLYRGPINPEWRDTSEKRP